MAENTKISWCDHTINLWWGCTKVHTGCKNCYAEKLSVRWKNDIWGENKSRKLVKSAFSDLDKFQRKAAKENTLKTVFIGSMMDIFEEIKPKIIRHGNKCEFVMNEFIDNFWQRYNLFYRIGAGAYPNLIFLFLTKRPENIDRYIPDIWKFNPPKNVWFGVSVSNQKTAEKYISKLLYHTPSKANNFISVEPQTGKVDISFLFENYPYVSPNASKINWVIQGCESGSSKRYFNVNWARKLKQQCEDAGIAYFLKQIPINGKVETDISKFYKVFQVQQFPKFEECPNVST